MAELYGYNELQQLQFKKWALDQTKTELSLEAKMAKPGLLYVEVSWEYKAHYKIQYCIARKKIEVVGGEEDLTWREFKKWGNHIDHLIDFSSTTAAAEIGLFQHC